MARARNWTTSRITLAIGLRILLVAALFSLLSFAMGLAAGLATVLLKGAMVSSASYSLVYRNFGLPAAFAGMFAGLVSMLVLELRQWRRPRVPPVLC